MLLPRTIRAESVHGSTTKGANGRLVGRTKEVDPWSLFSLTLRHLRLEELDLNFALFRGTPQGIILISEIFVLPGPSHGLPKTFRTAIYLA